MAKPSGDQAAPDLGASPIAEVTTEGPAAELPEFLIPYLTSLHESAAGEAVRSISWVYPTLETVHVIGLGLLFGGIFMLDLRLLGLNKGLSVSRLSRHVLPWVWIGFVLNLASGLMLFASDALSLAANISFQLKMMLLLLAGANAAVFQLLTARDMEHWDTDVPSPPGARLAAIISTSTWIFVITLGRLIAYWA